MRLSPEQCEAVVKSGLYLLKVGIDGASPSVHAMYRRGSNLETVHANIRTFLQKGKELGLSTPVVQAAFHVFAHNEGEIDELRKQIAELGIDYGMNAAWLPPNDSVSKPQDPSFDMHEQVNSMISALRSQGNRLKPCTWLHHVSVFNPGGSISPCCRTTSWKSDFGKLLLGNGGPQFHQHFKKIRNGGKFTLARGLFDRKRVALWTSSNLVDLKSDGMSFSTAQGSPMICAKCPIPHTLEQWSDEVNQIHSAFLIETLRCARTLSISRTVV